MHTSRPSRLAFLAVATLIMTVSAGTSCDPTSVTPVVSNVGSVAILVVDDFDTELPSEARAAPPPPAQRSPNADCGSTSRLRRRCGTAL